MGFRTSKIPLSGTEIIFTLFVAPFCSSYDGNSNSRTLTHTYVLIIWATRGPFLSLLFDAITSKSVRKDNSLSSYQIGQIPWKALLHPLHHLVVVPKKLRNQSSEWIVICNVEFRVEKGQNDTLDHRLSSPWLIVDAHRIIMCVLERVEPVIPKEVDTEECFYLLKKYCSMFFLFTEKALLDMHVRVRWTCIVRVGFESPM